MKRRDLVSIGVGYSIVNFFDTAYGGETNQTVVFSKYKVYEKDITLRIQSFINDMVGKVALFDEDNILYDLSSLKIPSNTSMFFTGKCIFNSIKGFSKYQKMINIVDVENVIIIGDNLTINMINNQMGDSEWRHAINIEGAKNIFIRGLKILNSGGDSIYIGAGKIGYSKNVFISDIFSLAAYRNGISIISAVDIVIKNCVLNGAHHKWPAAGLDIEPNHQNEIISNIDIINCNASNNKGAGFQVFPANLNNNNQVKINFIECTSTQNGSINKKKPIYGFMANRSLETSPKGSIRFMSCVSIDDNYGAFMLKDWSAKSSLVSLVDFKIIQNNKQNYQKLLYIYNSFEYHDSPGNLSIYYAQIFIKNKNVDVDSCFYFENEGKAKFESVKIVK